MSSTHVSGRNSTTVWLRGLAFLSAYWLRDTGLAFVKDFLGFVLFLFRYTGALAIVAWCLNVYIRLNYTRVHGKKYIVPTGGPKLYVYRHRSLLETYGLPALLFFPWALLFPGIIPWTLADKKNYKGTLFEKLLAELTLIIPVRVDERGNRNDPEALKIALGKLEAGQSVAIYPEGGRESPELDGVDALMPFAPGVALLAQHAASVIIVTTEGMQNVQTYYKYWYDQPRRWFDWIGRKFLWKFWCDGRGKFVDIAVARPITREDISELTQERHGRVARRAILEHLEEVMREKTEFLRKYRARTHRTNQRS